MQFISHISLDMSSHKQYSLPREKENPKENSHGRKTVTSIISII